MHDRSAGKSADLPEHHVLENGTRNLSPSFLACAASFECALSGLGLATCRLSQYPEKQHVYGLPEAVYSSWASAIPIVEW